MNTENKYKCWVFTIMTAKDCPLPEEPDVIKFLQTYSEKYVFQKEQAASLHFQGVMRLSIRKRLTTVLREFSEGLKVEPFQLTIAPMKGTWEQASEYCTKSETAVSIPRTNEVTYSADDIKCLDNPETRYPWQNKLINLIFEEDSVTTKVADDRSIIWVEDPTGGQGKSKLVKWCCFHNDSVVKISFGTSQQLRSAIIAAGRRRAYFIDVPRTLGSDDSMASLMSAVEDLKNGFVVSSMYGKNQQLMLDPPHIVCFSNLPCPDTMMSKDRWKKYTITAKQLFLLDGSDFLLPQC